MYDFDDIIDRRGSGCVKWDQAPEGLLPLWVADMDFRTPDFIIDAIKRRLDCPVLGYPVIPEDYFSIISDWVGRIHGWKVDISWICYVPGIVKGIGLVECGLFPKGTKVIIQPPVYHPFRIVTQKNGMEVLRNPLKPRMENGRLTGYDMDFDSLQDCISRGGKLLLLSNPQNPSGLCWDRATLARLAEITDAAGVTVISDEIHSEMAHAPARHIPYASVSGAAAHNGITFMAPTKTFNIAGVVSSYAIIPDPQLRERFFSFMDANELDYPPIFPIEATLAAYTKGEDWRREMLGYVEDNIGFVDDYLERYVPGIRALRPQASFLIWLDCRGLGLPPEELVSFMERRAGLYLNDGSMFGQEGEGFMRLNAGCPRSILEQAMEQLREAVSGLRYNR